MDTTDIKNQNKTRKVPTLKELCQKQISNYDFERLHEIANTSKHHVTKAFKKPSEMKYSLLVAISNLLGESAIHLIDTYDCGLDGLSAKEYRELLSLNANNETIKIDLPLNS